MEWFDGRGFTCRRVTEGGQPVLSVFRDTNGDWELLCGGDEHDDDTQVVLMHAWHLVEEDASLRSTGRL